MRTMGLCGLRRATSLKPALSYMDFAPNHMHSSFGTRRFVDRIEDRFEVGPAIRRERSDCKLIGFCLKLLTNQGNRPAAEERPR